MKDNFYRKLWKITLPIALQSLMLSLVAAGDALMLGSVEQNYMSAVSLATQIQFIQNMFLSSVVVAVGILGAQYWGKGDKQALDRLFVIGLRWCGVISLMFFAGCMLIPEWLMYIFTDEQVLVDIGVSYLRLAGGSYLLTGISQCYLEIMKISEHVTHTAVISSGAVILNILLNAVFIYGAFGLPEMNERGAALATLIARSVELAACVICSFGRNFLRPDLGLMFKRMGLLGKDFWKCMWPILGASLFWGVGFTSYSAFMGHLGTDAAAANSVAAVVRDLVCCMCNGLAGGASIIVGNELGAGNPEQGKRYGIRLARIAFIIGGISAALMLAATPPVLAFAKMTEEARHYLLQMMIIMAFYMIGRAVNTIIINGIFSAGGDTMFDMYSLAVTMWGMAIPLAVLGTFFLNWPVAVVYACTCLDEVGKIPWVLIHFRKYKWVKDLTR